ncbi:maleylacetoacetate isomerase [Caulobacter flavus]|uniref:Maleylacetoacetate isomerase n=1 Tax=Caulobacter flavus TaxID=1679497 RepID=A0A2N5CM44_9CAUL|nr:maleylacetoacetate isomerase [Caulobacter flavus]AYV48121.1 maleylacetoacetate isomerase [Caulobacter flavus]PLR06954.1 maleylacetoacetate isomerase [Caulobacter flavus]
MILHGYFRSTASWRVRIALGLKGLAADQVFHHLRRGEQRAPDYLAINPQGLLPALALGDGRVLTQSLAIVEYLDETHPEPPLLPADPFERAQVRAVAQAIACDIHPVQNLKILARLRDLGLDEPAVQGWAAGVIEEGLGAVDKLLAGHSGRFAFGDAPGLADLALVPQLGNARRFGVDLRWNRLTDIEAACLELDAFKSAVPSAQPDAE